MFTDPTIQPAAVSDQIRPRGGDDRFYAPERDIAYIGVAIIREALLRLSQDPINDNTYSTILAHVEDPDARIQQLCEVAKLLKLCLIRAGREAPTRLTDLMSTHEELNNIDPHVLCAVMAQIGELAVACMYQGILDVTPVDGEAPHQPTIASTILAAEKFIKDTQQR